MELNLPQQGFGGVGPVDSRSAPDRGGNLSPSSVASSVVGRACSSLSEGSGILAAIMSPAGRPTNDPKHERLTIRVSARDVAALKKMARESRCSVADAARQVLRRGLGLEPAKKESGR